jgi:hypothetical protein
MNRKIDELTKGLAQAVTRRAALKKFGVGLAGLALACFGLANKAEAAGNGAAKNCTKCVNRCLASNPSYTDLQCYWSICVPAGLCPQV